MSFTSATFINARNFHLNVVVSFTSNSDEVLFTDYIVMCELNCVGNAAVFVVMLVSSWQLSILSELSHSNEKMGLLIGSQTGTDHFQLKLAPPPLFEE